MMEWWTYRPEDFLLFSPRVYWRLFELHNTAWWPLHLASLGCGIAILLLAMRQGRNHARAIALVLAMLWGFVGWSFLWSRYAGINWTATYIAPAFFIQALLLATIAGPGRLAIAAHDRVGRLGLVLVAIGVIAYPLLPFLFGRPWTAVEVFGIAPDPTAIATLGLLAAVQGRSALVLIPIPVLWLVSSGLTLHTMGDMQAWLPLSAAGMAAVLLILRRPIW